MAEIHPNDIGLATYEDVGDVKNLQTAAKTIVEAVNEVYQTGGKDKKIFGTQKYVSGEGNLIIGENNYVHGNNNFIIGNGNIVIGDNHTLIQNEKVISGSQAISVLGFNASDSSTEYYLNTSLVSEIPLKVGDKVIMSAHIEWINNSWTDSIIVKTPLDLVEIAEIDEERHRLKFKDLNISADPPDEDHQLQISSSVNTFYMLDDMCKSINTKNAGLNMGRLATGSASVALNSGNAYGMNSFAANYSTADAVGSASVNSGRAKCSYSFAANGGVTDADNSTAINRSRSYSRDSFACGNDTRIYTKVIKLSTFDAINKTLTLAPNESSTNLMGKTLIVLAYNRLNAIMFEEIIVTNIDEETGVISFSGNTKDEILLPGNTAFVLESYSSDGYSSFVGGQYSIAARKHTFADGFFVRALHDGSAIFGKYGATDSDYGLFLGNGTSVQNLGLAFKVLTDGSVHADSAYTSPCADYAEYFEWKDGNPDGEDRAGYFVKLDGDKIVKCGEFDEPIGVVSATPAIIGDSGEMHWHDKYITDDFGRIRYHDVLIPEEKDEEGNIIAVEHYETQPIINPEWDNTKEYVPRKHRVEWATVGVLGKLIVYDDGTLEQGSLCRPGENGKAVKSTKTGYPVLKRISADKVLIWVK